MKRIAIFIASLAVAAASCSHKAPLPEITAPPADSGLDPFYGKYLDVNGIRLISSPRVSDEAMYAAYRTLHAMTSMLPDEVRASMVEWGAKVAVMAVDEVTTDIPEHAFLKADTVTDWNTRARGLGGDREDPTTSCAEENVLCLEGDRYASEDILVHEFAHAIHQLGIAPVDASIDERLSKALEKALAEGKWRDTYAATNIYEYWAEGVQSWFNVNTEAPEPNGVHNAVNTRRELRRYDPALYAIIADYFPATRRRISAHEYRNEYEIK